MDIVFPPGPPNTRESLLRFSRDPIAFFLKMMQSYGAFSYVRVGTRDTYVVCDPALVQRVYVDDLDDFDKDDHTKLASSPTGEGLVVLTGARHKLHRRIMQPLFTPSRIAEYADTVSVRTEQVLKTWQIGQVRDLETDLAGLTMGIVGEAIFGIHSNNLHIELMEAIGIFQRYAAESRYRSHFSDEYNANYHQAVARFEQIARNVLAQAQPNGCDFVSMMTSAVDPETGEKLTEQEIIDETRTLLLAGYETTVNMLVWTWYLLGKHPDIELQIRAELHKAVGDGPVTFNDLPKLRLLADVFKESLRLYPPIWLMGRRVVRPVELGGYHLPTDAVLAISPYVMHRNPEYFPEPETFKPERFATELPKNVYIPFGLGAHVCIGQHFALMEATLIMANVMRRFHLALPPGYVAIPEGLGTLKPKTKIMVTLEQQAGAK